LGGGGDQRVIGGETAGGGERKKRGGAGGRSAGDWGRSAGRGRGVDGRRDDDGGCSDDGGSRDGSALFLNASLDLSWFSLSIANSEALRTIVVVGHACRSTCIRCYPPLDKKGTYRNGERLYGACPNK